MPTPPLSDEVAIATVMAVRQYGSASAAARALGIPEGTFRWRYRVAQERNLDVSSGIRDALASTGIGRAEARGGWRKIKDPETGSFNSVYFRVPDLSPEDVAERMAAVLANVPARPPVSSPEHADADMLNLVAIGDAHIGMMAWGEETGNDWNTRAGCDRLFSWVSALLSRLPSAGTCVILAVGDLLHADSYVAETPASKHRLDVDTRHPKTLEAALLALVAAIDVALERHGRVIVRCLPGNHDPNAMVALRLALASHYRSESRATVVKSPSEFFVHQFGNVMLAAHHGHRAKPNQLVHFIADEFAEIWGRTRFRYLFTGHLHSMASQDIGGMQWEQLPAIMPRDAWSYGGAWINRARMFGIAYHREFGEYLRVTVAGNRNAGTLSVPS